MIALAILAAYLAGALTHEAIKRKKLKRKLKEERLTNQAVQEEQADDDDSSDSQLETHEVHVDGRAKLKRKFLRSTRFKK